MTEQEMRDSDVPYIQDKEELMEYITSLVNQEHSYGTAVYAMSMAAVATFNYVAHELGVTGFQASCADMDILRRTRSLKYGFELIDYGKLLYPQYWDTEYTPIFTKVLKDDLDVWAERAAELLKTQGETAVASVKQHWQIIANKTIPFSYYSEDQPDA